MIQPSVPELTLLCDGEPGMSWAARQQQQHNSNTTAERNALVEIQSAGSGAANVSTESVSSVGSHLSVNSPQTSIQSSSVMQQIARQPQKNMKSRQPVTGTISCHQCTTCQMNMQQTAYIPDNCGLYSMPQSADIFVHGITEANTAIRVSVAPDNVQNGALTAGNMRMHNASPMLAACSTPQVTMPCQACCVPVNRPAVRSAVAHNGSHHVVKAVPSSLITTLPYGPQSNNTQQVTSGPRQNGQFHQYPVQHSPHSIHLQHAPSEGLSQKTKCSYDGHLTPQRAVMPVRSPSVVSRQLSHGSEPHQAIHMPNTDGLHLPLKVRCASHRCQCCVSPSSRPVAAKVMPCSESHQSSTSAHAAGQQCASEAFHFSSPPSAQLMGPRFDTPVCQQGPDCECDSNCCASHSKSSLKNDSRQVECDVDLQRLSSQTSASVTGVPVASCGPRTVNDLLHSIPVQNIDWSVVLPRDIVTVDGFVESVLGRNCAFVDSGLQVSDSAVTSETSPKTLAFPAADSSNSILYDAGECDDDGSRQSVNTKKFSRVDVEPAACGQLGYVHDIPKVAEKLSSCDGRPKLFSVAVNTSLYWPQDDNGYAENWCHSSSSNALPNDARFSPSVAICSNNYDNTAWTASDVTVQRNHGCDSPSGNIVLQSDRDIKSVVEGSPGACDSLADISLCTPPPPILPHASEESVVSEMIMDMPEYTTLSQDK